MERSLNLVGVVIPTFRAGEMLSKAILSVRKAASESTISAHIIVVDNHPQSYDSRYAVDADEYLNLKSNPGFGSASNFGINAAFGNQDINWVLLLNPDAILDETFFQELTAKDSPFSEAKTNYPIIPLISFNRNYKTLKVTQILDSCNSKVSKIQIFDDADTMRIFGPDGNPRPILGFPWKSAKRYDTVLFLGDMEDQQKLTVRFLSEADSNCISKEIDFKLMNFESDQIVQNAGSEVRSPFSAGDLGTGSLTSITSLNSPGFRSVWCGAAVILPRKYFIDLGGFDETFFLYYEDTEFSIRAWNQDLYPFLIPKLKVLHEHSGITGANEIERGRTINRSRILFSVRTAGSRYAILFIIFTLLRTFKLLMYRKTTLRHFLFKLMPEWHYMILGFMDGILKKPKLNGGHKL